MTEVAVNAEQARRRADQIKVAIEGASHLIIAAYQARDWEALGYTSWDDYTTREFGSCRLKLPLEERQQVVHSFRDAGMSIRAIASATGDGYSTVRRALSGEPNGSPVTAVNPSPALSHVHGEGYPHEEYSPPPQLIVGVDGKRYASQPQRSTIADAWTEEERDLQKRLQANETVVVTLRGAHANLIEWADRADLYVRIDRRSEWGNPFELPDDGDRTTVIRNYAEHYLPFKPSLLAKLETLRGKALGCWCAPEPCHGDILKTWAEE